MTIEQSIQKELDKHIFKLNTSKVHVLYIIRLVEMGHLIQMRLPVSILITSKQKPIKSANRCIRNTVFVATITVDFGNRSCLVSSKYPSQKLQNHSTTDRNRVNTNNNSHQSQFKKATQPSNQSAQTRLKQKKTKT